MSNDNLQFCIELKLQNREELVWWSRHLNVYREDVLDATGAENLELAKDKIEHTEYRRFVAILDHVSSGSDVYDFEHCISHSQMTVTLFAEETGEPWEALVLAHYFFKDMRPSGVDRLKLTWAGTCSQSIPDGFYGGTGIATRAGVVMCGPDEQLDYCELQRIELKEMPE